MVTTLPLIFKSPCPCTSHLVTVPSIPITIDITVTFIFHSSYSYLIVIIIIIKQKYEVHTISFQTFFVWAHLLIVHTWNSSPLQSNILQLQCTCCTVLTTSWRPYRSPLVWMCQWPLSQPLSSPQLSHNDSLWA